MSDAAGDPQEREPEWQSAFEAHLKDKWVREVDCPICQSNEWVPGQILAQAPEYPSSGLPRFAQIGAGRAYPLVAVFCTNCGYTVFFNSLVAGITRFSEHPVTVESTARPPSSPPPAAPEG